MSKEHIAQYRLYDRDDNLVATGQAALDQWRPGLISRWIVPPDDKPPRRISDEARYRGRRRRLRKRLQKRPPLFWRDLEQAELEERAQYYGLPAPLTPPEGERRAGPAPPPRKETHP